VALAAGALDAFAADDARRLGAIVAEIGWFTEAEAHDGHAVARRIAGPLLHGETRLDEPTLEGFAQRALDERDELVRLAIAGSLPPDDLWPLRMLGGLGANLAQLRASGDWIALARTALRDGWS
jgi:hypothetical protein